MNSNIQIQSLKSQIDSMKLQINNIEIQNNNMMIADAINEQLLNLSIQMFNAGIQSFTTGKNLYMCNYPEKFYKQIINISKQINSFISEYKYNLQKEIQPTIIPVPSVQPLMIQPPKIQPSVVEVMNPPVVEVIEPPAMQQTMMCPTEVQHQNIQQQKIQQEFDQQQMLIKQMIAEQMMIEQHIKNEQKELIKFKFINAANSESVEIQVNNQTMVKDLLNKFREKKHLFSINTYKFICGGENIKMNDYRKVKDLLNNNIIFFVN